MKKLSYSLFALCMSAVMFVACDPNNPSNPGNPTEQWDPAEDAGLSQWEICIKHIKPGIYQGLTDKELNAGMNMGYDKTILAICEDGSAFYVDLDKGGVIAPITCYDGDLTFTNVSASEPKIGQYEYDKDIIVCSREKLTTLNNIRMDIGTQLNEFAILFGFDTYFYKGTMIGKYFRKIDDAKDFKSTYEKVFKLAIKKGDYVPYEDLFTANHTIYGDGWHNELYPSDMNTQRWVVPYDGDGKIERFNVHRQRNWGYSDGRWHMFYGPCSYELVESVECDVACERDEALRWHNKITDMKDRYTYTLSSKTGISEYFVGYGYFTNDEGCDTEGWKGYVTPYYEMEWMPKVGSSVIYPMNIKFGVEWVTYV